MADADAPSYKVLYNLPNLTSSCTVVNRYIAICGRELNEEERRAVLDSVFEGYSASGVCSGCDGVDEIRLGQAPDPLIVRNREQVRFKAV